MSAGQGMVGRLSRLWRPARPEPAAASPLRRAGADWAWRPGPWAGQGPSPGDLPGTSGVDLGDGVRLFHDAVEPTLELMRPGGEGRAEPLQLGIGPFDGGFLSLAIALPEGLLRGLTRQHIIGIEVDLGAAGLPRAFARLNLRQGPNAEAILRGLPETGPTGTEFDLWAVETEVERVGSGWIDLIFEAPLPARIALDDLVIARMPRAAF